MQIRPVRPTDAEPVNELLAQLGYPQDDPAVTAARLQSWTDHPTAAAFGAVADNELLGVIAVHIYPFFQLEGTSARIIALVVSDRARGQGIGSRLVAAAETFATDHGCLRMEVTSADHRRSAHTFYENRGYTNQSGTSSRFIRALR
jgi:GNAT superfamily N-acetyltransferase